MAPQYPTSSPALRHLCPRARAGPGLVRLPPGSAGQLVLQGAQVPPADSPGPRFQGLLHSGLLPGPCRRRSPAPRLLMPGLQAVDSGHCSCHPEEKRTVKSRENCTSLVGIWGQLRQMRGEGNGTSLQYARLENPMDRGAWCAAVHGVSKSRARLSASLSLFTFMHWRRKWQPTPLFLPGESQGWGSLVGSRLWGHTELDMTEVT